MAPIVARHRTAIHRTELSRPVRTALSDGLLNQQTSFFDYGCGLGDDLQRLQKQKIECRGWDPAHYPDGLRVTSDVVNLGYVINVIEDPTERIAVLQEAWQLTSKLLIVSARLSAEARDKIGTPFSDGLLTRAGTFQKFFEQHELREWIDSSLNISSVPAAPGVFYAFRDKVLHQSFSASRYRGKATKPRLRQSDALYEQFRELLDSLINYVTIRGRLPEDSELETAEIIRVHFGSLKRAWGVIRRVIGDDQWEGIRQERSQDLLIYLALSRFGKRPVFSQLPHDLQLDIRAFFSTYTRACQMADELLFSAGKMEMVDEACRKSPVGKLMPNALYLHTSAIPLLPPVLRIYEGCARAYIGAVDSANIIKLHRRKPQVSYLSYPNFERDPHPALLASLVVPLNNFHIQYREYVNVSNPPILHRKEEFVASEYPLKKKFARLTKQEEKIHLFDKSETIGTRDRWEALLRERGVKIQGHRLVKF